MDNQPQIFTFLLENDIDNQSMFPANTLYKI